jgi:hypothetical protein
LRKNLEDFWKSCIFAPNKKFAYMTKRLLIFSLAGLLVTVSPTAALAAEMELAAVEQADSQIGISISGAIVSITGAQGETLEVVSLTGRQVMAVKIDSPAQRVELNVPKGCYILKIGKVVRKIQVR